MQRLYGPREKVSRAKVQIVALQRSFEVFFKDNTYAVVVAELNRSTGYHSLRVQSGPESLPPVWSVIIGEIAHDLRSALDGLAWQLALDKTISPYDNTAFPIYLHGRTSRKGRGGNLIPHFWSKGDGLRLIQSIDRNYWGRIESFQPYKRGNGGRKCPLFLLQELNNTDKHRLITVLAPSASLLAFTGLSGGTKLKVGVTLRVNAKVGEVRDVPPASTEGGGGVFTLDPHTGRFLPIEKMQVNIRVGPGVRFGDSCDAVKRLPVIRTLQRISDQVLRTIEDFSSELA